MTATLRTLARTAVSEQVNAAAQKDHERHYEKLIVDRDGTLRWFVSINKSDELINEYANTRSISAIPSVITVGTGSLDCNCDYCNLIYDESTENRRAELAAYNAPDDADAEAKAAAEARAEYKAEAYESQEDAISEAVINSDLSYMEQAMLDEFDSIPVGYFDDETDEDESDEETPVEVSASAR